MDTTTIAIEWLSADQARAAFGISRAWLEDQVRMSNVAACKFGEAKQANRVFNAADIRGLLAETSRRQSRKTYQAGGTKYAEPGRFNKATRGAIR